MALPPEEIPKFKKVDLLHFDATVSLDSPKKVWASPGSDTVATRGIPEETEHVAHAVIINALRSAVTVSGSSKRDEM